MVNQSTGFRLSTSNRKPAVNVTLPEAVDVAEVIELVVLTGGAEELVELDELELELEELDVVVVLFWERIAKPPMAAMTKITTITTTIAMVLIAR